MASDLTNEDINFIRLKLDAVREGIYLTKREVRGLLDMAERCAKAEKAATTVEHHSFTGTDRTYEDLLAKEKAVGELLRAAKELALDAMPIEKACFAVGNYVLDDLRIAIEAAERAGVKP